MGFLSAKKLAEKYDVSERTVRRRYKKMTESGAFSYGRDYVKIGPLVRINEESFSSLKGE